MTNTRSYVWLFALLAVGGFVADQAAKYGIFAYLYSEDIRLDTPHITIVQDVLQLEASHIHVRARRPCLERDPGDQPLSPLRTVSGPCLPHVNRGALFGIGNSDTDSEGMNPLFTIISVLAACFILVWALRPSVAHDRLLSIALGLILGGTLGNLYDRVVFSGVRDFLHAYYHFDWPAIGLNYFFDWPVFNLADCCLVIGAGFLLLHSFVTGEKKETPAAAEAGIAQAAPLQATSSASDV